MIKSSSISAIIAGAALSVFTQAASAQAPSTPTATSTVYRAPAPKINDLIHTKLDVHFDYKKCYMYGKEWVTLKPHQAPTDSLRLDAKGMDIKTIAIVKAGKNIPLKYKYEDSLQLNIKLDKTYQNSESYTLYISYTSKPNELHVQGSAAINDAKGLYFINPDGSEKGKPTQIWTQGESESSSCWFPTIDKPNQKTTDEISMTVLSKYVTLSNGKLVSQKANADGTRTDTWKMDLPHSPYLFMMAVGDFKVYHDKWKDKPVDYYLEPKYAPYAKEIFGMTPEIIDFYSKTLGVDYPWNKYAQIVVRDYVSGAMENTTATLHGEYVQGTPRQLADAYYNDGRSTIAHELFHQWFGDYVTAESWSNLTVNESFADFSETLWAEHKYGQDEGDAHSYKDMTSYLAQPENAKKDLVRYYYNDKEDMFDVVTYQKGGVILNMLRNYLGRDVFYKGLGIYLKTNAFKNGNAQLLRSALEQGSGKDLEWFFKQWYYGAGHPLASISYKWDAAAKTETIYFKQSQIGQIFTLPLAIDVYQGGKKVRHDYLLRTAADSVTYQLAGKPDLVNVDADKKTLWEKTDNKTLDELVFQYFNAPLYVDRLEAVNAAVTKQTDKGAQKVLIAALNDKYNGLQLKAIAGVDLTNDDIRNAAVPILEKLAQTDPNNLVRAAAITALGKLKASGNMGLFKTALGNSSLAVQSAALKAIIALNPTEALPLAKSAEKDSEGDLATTIVGVYLDNGGAAEWPYIRNQFKSSPLESMLPVFRKLGPYLAHLDNPTYVQEGVLILKDIGIRFKAQGAGAFMINMLNAIKGERVKLNDTASATAIDNAIKEIGN